MGGKIYVGVGGWTYEPWRGTFYPEGLTQKRELAYMAETLTSVEINGTYYSTFKRDSWEKWAAEAPAGFRFAVKGSRYCTNRKVLSDEKSAESIARFVGQGLSALGDRLGPLNWQFMATKKFDEADFDGFLKLLPREVDGVPLRHALEVRHDSFHDPRFADLCRKHGVAIVYAKGDPDFPEIDAGTADFTYARLMDTREDEAIGWDEGQLKHWAAWAKEKANAGDVHLYVISGAKVRNPLAAKALVEALG
jgi:uncharacterized protein YecE (DUF72 family)